LSGQWDNFLKNRTIPLKTEHLVTTLTELSQIIIKKTDINIISHKKRQQTSGGSDHFRKPFKVHYPNRESMNPLCTQQEIHQELQKIKIKVFNIKQHYNAASTKMF
jgi:hypothetical protein